MRIFVAGASGAVGRRLVPMLAADGHEVTGTATSERGVHTVEGLGGQGVVLDALDDGAVKEAVTAARPDVVISQLTSLAGLNLDPRKFDAQFAVTNRLRTEGTAHLIDAAAGVGARRVIVQSFTGWTNPRNGTGPATEDEGLDRDPGPESVHTLAAIAEEERRVTEAPAVEGVVLRYGLLYGPGTSVARDGDMAAVMARRQFPVVGRGTGMSSFVHVDDAARATVAAVTRGAPGLYNVVDDEPVSIAEWVPALAEAVGAKPPRHLPAWLARPLMGRTGMNLMLHNRGSSNAKARRELGWAPAYPSIREGFRTGLG